MQSGFVEPMGVPYLSFLGHLHDLWKPNWYLEVGTQKGRSLVFARANAIAVDVEFRIEEPVVGSKRRLHLFQQTSDEFFASGFLSENSIELDFSFLDGMHLFEFLLRDFIATEAASRDEARIALHDCVPRNTLMASREWDKSRTQSWAGDVWKIIPILSQYRPDLKLTTWDCPPTGLVVVSGLDRESRVLSDRYNDILTEYMDLSLPKFGIERFFDQLKLADSRAAMVDGRVVP